MQDQKVLLNKVGRPGGQACETTFADNTLPLFHDLPGYTVTADAEENWRLLKATVISIICLCL